MKYSKKAILIIIFIFCVAPIVSAKNISFESNFGYTDDFLDSYATELVNRVLKYNINGQVQTTPATPVTDPNLEKDVETSSTPSVGAIDESPIKLGSSDDDCSTIFKNSDGSFNEFGQFMQDLFTLMKFAAPILVLALSTVDYAKAIANQNADEMKKANDRFVKRLVAGVIVFMLPFILDFLFDIFGLYGLDTCGIR